MTPPCSLVIDFKSESSNLVWYGMLISLDDVADNGMEVTRFHKCFLSRSWVMGYHFLISLRSGADVIYKAFNLGLE